MPENRVT